jgi:hypothetical protein
MREIRLSGSEGGGNGTTGPPYPYYPPTVEARMAVTGGGDGLVVEAPTMMVAQNRLPH